MVLNHSSHGICSEGPPHSCGVVMQRGSQPTRQRPYANKTNAAGTGDHGRKKSLHKSVLQQYNAEIYAHSLETKEEAECNNSAACNTIISTISFAGRMSSIAPAH